MRVRTGRFEKLRSAQAGRSRAIELGDGHDAVQRDGAVVPPATRVRGHLTVRLRPRLHRDPASHSPPCRASDAMRCQATRRVAVLLVRPFALRLLRPLLTSRSGSSPSPLFIGSRFRSTLPSHGRSPFRSCASLCSLWPACRRTSTSRIAPMLGAHEKGPHAAGRETLPDARNSALSDNERPDT